MLIAETAQGAQMMPFQLHEAGMEQHVDKECTSSGVCVFFWSLYSEIFRGAIKILFLERDIDIKPWAITIVPSDYRLEKIVSVAPAQMCFVWKNNPFLLIQPSIHHCLP